MSKTPMSDYIRYEMWMNRVEETITNWEKIQGIKVSDDVRQSVIDFMKLKIRKGITRNTLTKLLLQIAVTSLVYIKIKGWNNK